MSKLYQKYLELKNQDSSKMYLFRVGNFYIFLADDAYKINEYMVLKLTYFSKNVEKCGFPVSSYEKYKKVFENLKLDVQLVMEDHDRMKLAVKILERLESINIENVSLKEAFDILYELKGYVNGK